MDESHPHDRRQRLLDGVRAGLPFAVAGGLLALSFGVVAEGAGLSAGAAIAMSAIVFAGSAQFTAIAIIAQGGTVAAAVLAAALVNSRFLPMGVALGPSLPGGPLRRAAQGQAIVDASWGIAGRGDGTFDRWLLFGSTAVQYAGWSAARSPARSAATSSATRRRSGSTRSTRRSSSRCSSASSATGGRGSWPPSAR